MSGSHSTRFPNSVRLLAAVWLAVWLPTYWYTWGVVNFLHFCDISVILTSAGFLFGSDLLISSQAVASLLVDAVWTVDVADKLLFHRAFLGGTEYMFDGHVALWIRLLSLFHVVMPPVYLWAIRRNGYDGRGFPLQCAIAFVAFIASRCTNPALNLNYVFADPFLHRQFGPATVHILVAEAFMVIVIYLPTHMALTGFARLSRNRAGGECGKSYINGTAAFPGAD
jgi:hypothetical protein